MENEPIIRGMCPLYEGCPLFGGFCFKFKYIDRDILRTIAPAIMATHEPTLRIDHVAKAIKKLCLQADDESDCRWKPLCFRV